MTEWDFKEISKKMDKLIFESQEIKKEINSLITRINVLEVQVEERTEKRVVFTK